MTSRLLRTHGHREDEYERQSLLQNQDDYEVRIAGSTRIRNSQKYEGKYSDDEDISLVNVGNAPPPPPLDQCVETEVQPGDTLPSLALKYNVALAELKRVNNILKENEFYALKRIRIPVKPASLLTELLPSVHEAKGESQRENGWYVKEMVSPILTGGTSSTVPSSPPSESEVELCSVDIDTTASKDDSKQTKKARRFLRNVDKDVARIKEKMDADSDFDESSLVDLTDDDDSRDPEERNNNAKLLLNSSSSSSRGVSNASSSSLWSQRHRTVTIYCCVFVTLIVMAVGVILLIAKYEFHNLEVHMHNSTHHDSMGHHHRRKH